MKFGQLIFIALISGFIGYSTNVLAIKALFKPYDPIKIGPFEFQGLIPKRHREISHKIGQLVAKEFLNEEDILDQFLSPEDERRFIGHINRRIQDEVIEKTWALPKMIQNKILSSIEEKLDKERHNIFIEVKDAAKTQMAEKVDMAGIIEREINKLDMKNLEELAIELASKELRAIEWLGLIMGVGIGFVQGIISLYIM